MSSPRAITPEAAVAALARKWAAHHASWLVRAQDERLWPLDVVLHTLTEKDVSKDLPGTREWVTSWRRWSDQALISWESRRWASGNQELPCRLTVPSADRLAQLLGKSASWAEGARRRDVLTSHFPQLAGSKAFLRQCDKVLLEYGREDFERLLRLLQWFQGNPSSGLYLRQLPVQGVDTKWVEPRVGVVGDLVAQILGLDVSTQFHVTCGLRKEPARIRLRILCPRIRALVRGLSDVEAPLAELNALQLEPSTFLVVENRNTGVALPDLPGTVAFMRLGLAVDQLDAIDWLPRIPNQLYWGDIDTHGFAALARARLRFPAMKSLLMDETTLLEHQGLWVEEPSQSRVERPEGLSTNELSVYEGLRSNRWGVKVRLEQERVAWPTVLAKLYASVPNGEFV
jgi:hypothetical protein